MSEWEEDKKEFDEWGNEDIEEDDWVKQSYEPPELKQKNSSYDANRL